MKRQITFALACALSLSLLLPSAGADAKAKKPKLSKSKLSMTAGKKKTIKIKNASGAKKVKWKSSKPKVASVKKKGKLGAVINAKKKGTATVSVSFRRKGKKKSLKCKITVNPKKGETTAPTTTSTPAPSVKPSQNPAAPSASASSETPPPRDTSSYEKADIVSNSFDENWDSFVTRQAEGGTVEFSLTDDAKYVGKALKVSGRQKTWNGAWLDLTGTVIPSASYHVEFWVKQEVNAKKLPDIFYCTTETAAVENPTTDEEKTWIYVIDAGTKVDRNGAWAKVEGTFSVPASSKHFGLCFETKGFLNNFILDEFHLDLVSAPAPKIPLTSLNELYKDKFIVGNATNRSELQDPETVEYIKNMYGSFTMGNEMKPDAILNSTTVSTTSDTAKDYVIPDGYTESTVPTLNFADTDLALKTAAENNLKVRVHTLLWHEQTPSWFFKEGYSDDGALVSQDVMTKRLEFYVKSVMNHILSSEYADTVYAVDVVNEYFHSNGAENGSKYQTYWQKIYDIKSSGSGSLMTNTTPPYVKSAFVYAYDIVKKYNKTESVKLYYNDFNTYLDGCADKIVELINWINTTGDGNTDGKICAGVGMQSHLDTALPSFETYKEAFDKFVAAGFDIQITELDITMGGTSSAAAQLTPAKKAELMAQQTKYYKDLMQLYLDNSDSVSAVVFWGLSSQTSWRSWGDPCIFGRKGKYDVKDVYKELITLGGGTFPPAA